LACPSFLLYNTYTMKTAQDALQSYNIGEIKKIIPIHNGFINETCKIEATAGDFILQKMSPIFKPQVMEDIQAALKHLKKNGLTTMEIIKTKNGALSVADQEIFWRMLTYVEGQTFERVESEHMAYEAGKLLGTYHRVLNTNFNYKFKHVRSIKHNIPAVYEKYKKIIEKNTSKELKKFFPVIDRVIALDLPKDLRKSVGHGDTKITNFIFSTDPVPKTITMVDFDDVGRHSSILYELGSAFRSWCAVYDGEKTHFSLEYFAYAFRGYWEGSKKFLMEKEFALIPRAIEVQCLQLASRFVRDYFEGNYFRFDPSKFTSRQAHSVYRTNECIDLYNEIEEKKGELLSLIKKIAN